MLLSSSDGTTITIEQMEKAEELLKIYFERIQEINNGTYKRSIEAKQFDYCTCPPLSNAIDNILEIAKKIDDLVYQNK